MALIRHRTERTASGQSLFFLCLHKPVFPDDFTNIRANKMHYNPLQIITLMLTPTTNVQTRYQNEYNGSYMRDILLEIKGVRSLMGYG